MSYTIKMRDTVNDGYFENLRLSTKDIVKELILKHAENRNGPDGYKSDTECLEDIECHSRDGFIPFSHNKGGLDYNNFCTLSDYNNGGYVPASPKAASEIERQIEYSYSMARDMLAEKIGPLDMEHFFNDDKENLSYHGLSELEENLKKSGDTEKALKVSQWLREYESIEQDCFNGDSDSIMHQLRFFYHGKDAKGIHQASIVAVINCEGPYHRAGRNEGCKEIEIQWRNNAELKRKLDKALAKASKAVF